MSAVEAVPETFEKRLPPPSDRMMTTLFIAGLLHAIIILGVSFSAPPTPSSSDLAPTVEVVLVSERTPPLDKNPKAQYLAQRNQKGAGNTRRRERARIPKSSKLPIQQAGIPGTAGMAMRAAAGFAGSEQAVASHSAAIKIEYLAPSSAPQAKPEVPELLENRPDLGLAANDDEPEFRLRGETGTEKWVTADTRESNVAVYLDAWRRKVERIGTINFPSFKHFDQQSGTPVIEVKIGADGKLVDASIRHSSGSAQIDQAALTILKLASPFDPFPQALSREHDELRFAYEWQFLSGKTESSSIYVSDPASIPEVQ